MSENAVFELINAISEYIIILNDMGSYLILILHNSAWYGYLLNYNSS